MTPQELFDEAITYLRSMKRQAARASGACMYRSPHGPCLVGKFLTDTEAAYADDLGGVDNLVDADALPEHLMPHCGLLRSLQRMHDNPDNWGPDGFKNHGRIAEIARQHNLKVPA